MQISNFIQTRRIFQVATWVCALSGEVSLTSHSSIGMNWAEKFLVLFIASKLFRAKSSWRLEMHRYTFMSVFFRRNVDLSSPVQDSPDTPRSRYARFEFLYLLLYYILRGHFCMNCCRHTSTSKAESNW